MNPILQIERQILQESQEWARRRLEEQLQGQADQVAMICPKSGQKLSNTRSRKMKLRTVCGWVRLRARVGYSQAMRRWVNPVRGHWGLAPYQRVSPELQARICHTATIAPSYESAVEVAQCWGCQLDDDLFQRQVAKVGPKVNQLALPNQPAIAHEADFSMVIMMDGWMARERGLDWGASRRRPKADRVAWHEIKSAVIYRLDQAAKTASGRGLLLQKYVVASPPETDPVDFGARVHAEAMRRGLGRAKKVYVVMDGAVWLWCLARSRFSEAVLILDFHHARDHLKAVAQALYPNDSEALHLWLDPLIKQLQNGKEARVVSTLEELLAGRTSLSLTQAEILEREANYFGEHRDHIHYRGYKRIGAPRGSGAVESLGGQLQRRFRTCGQFWKRSGLKHLLDLAVTFKNRDQVFLWN